MFSHTLATFYLPTFLPLYHCRRQKVKLSTVIYPYRPTLPPWYEDWILLYTIHVDCKIILHTYSWRSTHEKVNPEKVIIARSHATIDNMRISSHLCWVFDLWLYYSNIHPQGCWSPIKLQRTASRTIEE